MVIGTLPSSSAPTRTVESEGILRMLLLVLAMAMPLATLAYLKIQSTRLSYAMGEIKDRIHKEEELHASSCSSAAATSATKRSRSTRIRPAWPPGSRAT